MTLVQRWVTLLKGRSGLDYITDATIARPILSTSQCMRMPYRVCEINIFVV